MNTILLVLFWIFVKVHNFIQQIYRLYFVVFRIEYRRYDDPKTGMYQFEMVTNE